MAKGGASPGSGRKPKVITLDKRAAVAARRTRAEYAIAFEDAWMGGAWQVEAWSGRDVACNVCTGIHGLREYLVKTGYLASHGIFEVDGEKVWREQARRNRERRYSEGKRCPCGKAIVNNAMHCNKHGYRKGVDFKWH